MAKRPWNGEEEPSDAWLLNMFADSLCQDAIADIEAVGDVNDVSDGLELLPEFQPPSDSLETDETNGTRCNVPSPHANISTASAVATETTAATAAIYTDPTLYCSDDDHIDATEVIAQELSRMTIGERQVIFEDINGITPLNEETPMFLSAKLDDLQVELTLIKEKPAYSTAMEQNSAFVEDDALRLKFLRCVQYNPSIAAQRMVAFFETKLELFDLEILTEEITMYDLCPEAQALLASGRVQKLPTRDSAGRVVMTWVKFDAAMFSTNAPAQFFFYFTMMMPEDEATQMSGLVIVHVRGDETTPFTIDQRKYCDQAANITRIVPLKVPSFHFVAENDPALHKISSVLRLSFSKEVRHRFRAHFGSFRTCKEALASYGIPVSIFPLTDDGDMKMDAHLQWLEQRKIKEAVMVDNRRKRVAQENTQIIPTTVEGATASVAAPLASPMTESTPLAITPTEKDVLLGRGRLSQIHAGNLQLKEVIADWYDKYDATPRMAKTAIAENLVHLTNKRGGRFLKKIDGVWNEVDPSEAREKVSHGFRKKRETDAAKLRLTSAEKAPSAKKGAEGPKKIKCNIIE